MIERLKKLYRKLRKFYYSYVKAWFVYRETAKWHILDNWETLDYLCKHHCSMSRYGDGEFGIVGGQGNGFQKADAKLAARLKEVILSEDAPNFMVAVPYPLKYYKDLKKCHAFWPEYVSRNIQLLCTLIKRNKTYLNTQVTRFYFERKDKSRCREHLRKLRSLWDDRDIVIVEGTKTRSGVGNDLYDNAKSVHRILGYSENAFAHYDEMLEAIVKNTTKNQLILLCYGMTATVLAYDLAKLGYWAMDIGHIDIEYEWMRMGATERTLVKGKHVNELKEIGGTDVGICHDAKYVSEVVADITK